MHCYPPCPVTCTRPPPAQLSPLLPFLGSQVALKRHDMDSAAQTMTAAKDKHPAVRKQLRASLEDIEEAAVESEKLCRTLRGRFKFVRSSAGGAPEERPREARTGVAERDGKAGGGAESSGAAGVGSEGGARVQEEATGGVGGDRGGDGAGAGSLNGVGGSGEATVSGGAKRGREEGVEGGEGVGVGEGGGRKRVRFATETKGGEGAGSAEGGTEPGAAGGGVEGRGGGVGGAGGLAGTSMQPLGGGGESTCAVCLDSLEVEGAAIHVYPCGHRFHAACGERLWDDPVQVRAERVVGKSGEGGTKVVNETCYVVCVDVWGWMSEVGMMEPSPWHDLA